MFKIVKFVSFDLVDNDKKLLDNIVNNFGNINNSDIAENNIELAKKMDNVEYLCSSIVGWLNANTDKNLLDLEKKFRFLNNGIYLIPRESEDENNKIFSIPNFNKKEKYYLSVIINNEIDIIKYYDEIGVNSEKILRRLPRTGLLFPKDVDINKLLNYKNSKLNELETKHKLIYNFCKLEKKLFDPALILENDIKEYIKENNKNPDQKIIASFDEINDDIIVGYGVTVEENNEKRDEFISYIGHYIKQTKDKDGNIEKQYQLVDIRDLFYQATFLLFGK